MADFITPLQWIPTSKQIRGRKLHDEMVEVYGALLIKVKARMDAGEDVPDCLAKTLWQIRDQENLDWEDMCMLTAVFVLGGVHSVRNVLFMTLQFTYPFTIDCGNCSMVPRPSPIPPRRRASCSR